MHPTHPAVAPKKAAPLATEQALSSSSPGPTQPHAEFKNPAPWNPTHPDAEPKRQHRAICERELVLLHLLHHALSGNGKLWAISAGFVAG